MSRSRKLFDLIQLQVPGTVVCGRFLIIKPTSYVVRGFLLDTTPHKDKMKLLRVVMPLYRPLENLSLNYSSMISGDHAGLVHVDRKAYPASAAIVRDKIRPHVEALSKLRGPQEFLSHISWMATNRTMSVRRDFGLTHVLLGNLREAHNIFRQIDMDFHDPNPTQDGGRATIKQILDLVERDPPALLAVLERWRNANIEKLGLTASVAPTALRLVQSV